MKRQKRIILNVAHRRLNGRGFGCYFGGSAKRGSARIVVDCDALAWTAAEVKGLKFKRMFIETIGHEFMHAIEDLFGLMFDESAVEKSIHKARRKLVAEKGRQ